MSGKVVRTAMLIGALAGAGAARADFVSVLQATPNALGDGVYTLEIRGNMTQPATYSAPVTAQPLKAVPLPGSAAIFACGILAMAFTAARSRRR